MTFCDRLQTVQIFHKYMKNFTKVFLIINFIECLHEVINRYLLSSSHQLCSFLMIWPTSIVASSWLLWASISSLDDRPCRQSQKVFCVWFLCSKQCSGYPMQILTVLENCYLCLNSVKLSSRCEEIRILSHRTTLFGVSFSFKSIFFFILTTHFPTQD